MSATPLLTIEQILAALAGTQAARFNDALDTLSKFEAEPVVMKSKLAELRTYGINRGFEAAWNTFVRRPFVVEVGWENLSEEEQRLENSLGLYPEVHTAAGYLKRALAAEKAAGPMRDAMIAVLTVLVPLAARMEALKAKTGKPARQPTKTSIEREERDAKTMTCQCCARGILAETGTIAHHGYQRPGGGWQTASCPGAKQVPFEVSRTWLGKHIVQQREHLAAQREHLAKLVANPEGLTLYWTYSDRSDCTQPWHRGVDKMVAVTAATFDEKFEEAKTLGYKGEQTFEALRTATIRSQRSDITLTEQYIADQQARYDAWKQTHEWKDGAWVALAA